MKIYFESYGCSANQNNTEIMTGLIIKSGHEITNSSKDADIIVLNTCIVKGPTENRMKFRISELSALKKPIIIAGCMSDARLKELRQLNNNADIRILGTKNIRNIVRLIENKEKVLLEAKEIKLSKDKINKNPVISIIQISEGCLGNCSYCATKLAKGDLFSFPWNEILENIKNDLEKGAREVWLTSQDNSVYMLDQKKETRLPGLIDKILALDYPFFLRIGMLNPKETARMKEDIVRIMKNDKVFKFLHIPIQSGSNKILKAMNRDYTRSGFLELIGYFRKNIPHLTISTDIIVGFPGETEKDFQDTITLIKKTKPEFLNISRYWPMKGTKASKLKQINPEIVKKRVIKLFDIYRTMQDNRKWIGWKGKCLADNKTDKGLWARNSSYKKILIENAKESDFGKFVNIEITNTEKNYLTGIIV